MVKVMKFGIILCCMLAAGWAEGSSLADYADPKCHLCRGSGDMMKGSKHTCKCMAKRLKIYSWQFGEVYSNSVFMFSKPWRGKYQLCRLVKNSKGQLRGVRTEWDFGGNRPEVKCLQDEVRCLCAILSKKYGIKVKAKEEALSRNVTVLSRMDTYYHDKLWYVGITCRDGDRLFFDVFCKGVDAEDMNDSGIDVAGLEDL